MKFFGTDLSAKHIAFNYGQEQFLICFRHNFIKGVHDISVASGKKEDYFLPFAEIEVKSAYPSLVGLLKEIRILAVWEIMKLLERLHIRWSR